MDYIQAMRKKIERATKQEVQHQEQKIIQDYTAAGQITPQGINTAIKKLQAAATMSKQRQQALVIANAATAAAIRKQFSREEVEVIISQAVETTTAYVVTDETLKQQLLQSIDKRGVLTMQATINLTAVLITFIICVTLYALCKMAQKDKAKERKKEEAKVLEVPAFTNQRRSNQEQHLVEYVEGQVKKGEAKK